MNHLLSLVCVCTYYIVHCYIFLTCLRVDLMHVSLSTQNTRHWRPKTDPRFPRLLPVCLFAVFFKQGADVSLTLKFYEAPV